MQTHLRIFVPKIASVLFLSLFLAWPPLTEGGLYAGEAVVDTQANDLQGKVIVGYQGWFAPQGDGTDMGWQHYGVHHRIFGPDSCTFDMWPDMSEMTDGEKYPTDFKNQDGSTAYVFSSANQATVSRHFQWMREYGIDGAALQRFGENLRDPHQKAWRNRVLQACRTAASNNGRIWYIMYDLSGLKDDEVVPIITQDWKELVDSIHPAKDPLYAHFKGKPVVALWGVGFNDGRRYSLGTTDKLIDFFKSDPLYGSNAVILGVPYYWRDGNKDSVPVDEIAPLLKKADIVSPWSVTRYQNLSQAKTLGDRMIQPDMAWCRQNGLGYLPVVFPGFSWQNLEKSRGRQSPLNMVSREKGEFLWTQAASVINGGAQMIYVAMFDEIDEGTAIFKVTNTPPVGASSFATFDGLPSDFYLRLTGQIGAALRGPKPINLQMPSYGQTKPPTPQ